MGNETRHPPVAALAAAVLSIGWLAFALTIPETAEGLRSGEPGRLLELAAKVLVVPALLFAIAAAWRRPQVTVRQDLLAASEATESGAVAAAGSLAGRLAATREMLELDVAAVEALTERLGQAAGAAAATLREATATAGGVANAGSALEAAAARGLAEGERLRAMLEGLAGELEARRAGLAAEADRLAEERARLEAAHEALAEAAARSSAAISQQTGLAGGEAREALSLVESAAATLAETVAAQKAALEAATAEARATLAAIGSEAARALGRHLEALVAQARELESRISAQTGVTEELVRTADQGFQILDKRLEHAARTTGQTLDGLQARLAATAQAIDGLAEPIRGGRAAVAEVEQAVAALDGAVRALAELLSATLPERAAAATGTAESLATEVTRLAGALADAQARATALAEPVAASRATLDEATARFEAQREAVRIAGEALVVELEQARQLIAEVERATEATSLAAATRLVDALTRVRDVSQQATGTMREMLEGLVAEARQALGEAAQSALRAGFVEAVAEQTAAAEARAKAAAERSAQSLAALAEALRLVDSRAEERLRELSDLGARELASAAQLLTDRLAAESVTIASALGREMDAEDWAKWRAGERGLFKRRALALLEKQEAKALKALLERDSEFAGAARRFTAGFEALVARLESGLGAGLAAIIRNSETGRLAAALVEVLED
ncbi:hypothetical protein [Thermaurantiacus tibetensis]|uniref:hypothetical protein n=1 Tax=Thermaurantiacus tibetensis TaxID=2759035 RepID=UPI00188F944E|nr:hypothetical protein [Thermaurantiacus tibetensis]